jgi:hemolysin III
MNAVDELSVLPKWTQSPSEELANSISHGIGFVAALIGTPILLFAALKGGSPRFFIGAIIFTLTTLLLYFGSM